MTEQEALKRHKELWQGVIDFVNKNWTDIPDEYEDFETAKLAVYETHFGKRKIGNHCWLCEFYCEICHKCPLVSCREGSLYDQVVVTYEEMYWQENKHEREKHYKEFIELAEKIRDIGDERIKE